ncbi:MAG: hypothetical protein AAB638_01485 [Patescibacteria group bacterium]
MKRLLKFIVVLVLAFSMFPIITNAASFGLPFGGKILNTSYCTCSFNTLLTIGGPIGGTYMYQPGTSTLYRNYHVWSSGPWTVGITSGYSTCMVYSGNSCVSRGGGPLIRKIGTSAF